MKRILSIQAMAILLLPALPSEAPTQVTNAVTPCLPLASARTITEFRISGAGRRAYARHSKPEANPVILDRETALVEPGQSLTLDVPVGLNHLDPTSVEVRSGCLTYDFALYPNDRYTAGEELLVYQGQSLNLADRTPPMLRDDDLTGEVHARFWNRGPMGCTFRLLVTGGGF